MHCKSANLHVASLEAHDVNRPLLSSGVCAYRGITYYTETGTQSSGEGYVKCENDSLQIGINLASLGSVLCFRVVIIGTCTCTQVVLEYSFEVLVLEV